MNLRDYQNNSADSIEQEWQVFDSTLAVLATGMGKTLLMAEIIRRRAHLGRAVVIAHREELIMQAREKIEAFSGIHCEIEMADQVASPGMNHDMPVVIATIQTLVSGRNRARMERFNPMDFATVLCDECHHFVSETNMRALAHFRKNPAIKILGVTATPDRKDESALGQIFQSVATNIGILEGIETGWLVPVSQQMVTIEGLDFSSARTTAGDLNSADLAAIMEAEQVLHGLCSSAIEICGTRQTIVFTSSVKHAEAACNIFNRHKQGCAEWICGTTPKEHRRKIMGNMHSGKTQFLCNVGIATEGFDCPSVEVIVMGRPTKSRSLYAQCLDSITEILTPNGWKSENEVQNGDLVAAFDMESEQISYLPCSSKVVRYLADGESMWGISNPMLDIRVTGGHDMIFKRKAGRKRVPGNWTKLKAACISQHGFIPCAGKNTNIGIPLTDDELRFIGWVMTDGSVNKKTGQICITQGEHQPWLEEIQRVLDACGLKNTRTSSWRKTKFNQTSMAVRWTISRGAPRGKDKHLAGWGRLENYMSKVIADPLFGMSKRQFDIWIEAIHMGDGSKQENSEYTRRSYHISCGRREFADRLQHLCSLNGMSSNMTLVKGPFGVCHVVHIKPIATRSIGVHSNDGRQTWGPLLAKGNEIVWCVKNDKGTLITRRNGKVAVLGNCAGRATRPLGGIVDGLAGAQERRAAIAASKKPSCLLIDYVGNSGRHKLINGVDLLGGKYPDDEREEAERLLRERGDSEDIVGALEEAKETLRQKREKEAEERVRLEEARKARIKAKAKFSKRDVNPFDSFDIHPGLRVDESIGGVLTTREKERLSWVCKKGEWENMTYAENKTILKEQDRRYKNKLCSLSQSKMLARFGFDADMPKEKAGPILDAIAKNGWKVPPGMRVPVEAVAGEDWF